MIIMILNRNKMKKKKFNINAAIKEKKSGCACCRRCFKFLF